MASRLTGPDKTPGPDGTDDHGQGPTPDAVGGALDVIDRSIGMYVVRRLTGRGTTKPEEPAPPVVLSADQVAYRIGAVRAVPGATPKPADPPEPVAPMVAGTAAAAAAARAAAARTTVGRPAPKIPSGAAAPRERLVRDSGIALLALATIGLVAVVLWPHGPTGQPEQSVFGVNRTVVTPGPTGEVDAATAEATTGASGEPETAVPTSDATPPVVSRATAPIGQPTPTLPPGATPRPTAKGGPTPRPTATPTSTATAGTTPTPTGTPTPTDTPAPTPTDTPTPTPTDTPTPTPTDTPTPTPADTPDPTP